MVGFFLDEFFEFRNLCVEFIFFVSAGLLGWISMDFG